MYRFVGGRSVTRILNVRQLSTLGPKVLSDDDLTSSHHDGDVNRDPITFNRTNVHSKNCLNNTNSNSSNDKQSIELNNDKKNKRAGWDYVNDDSVKEIFNSYNLIKKPNVDKTVQFWKLLLDSRYQSRADQIDISDLFISVISNFNLKMKKEVAIKIFKIQYGCDNDSYDYHKYSTCFHIFYHCQMWRESITLLNDINIKKNYDTENIELFQNKRNKSVTTKPAIRFYYSNVIRTCFDSNQNTIARDTLDEYLKYGDVDNFDGKFFIRIMHSAFKKKYYNDVIDMFDLYLYYNNQHHRIYLYYDNQQHPINGMTHDEIDQMKDDTRTIFSIAINACNKLKNHDKGLEYIELCQSIIKVEDFDEGLYDVAMTCFAQNGAWELSLNFLNSFLSEHVSKIKKLKLKLQEIYDKNDENNKIERNEKKILKEIEIENLYYNANVLRMFNQVLYACAKGTREDIALQVLDCMNEEKFGEFGIYENSQTNIKIPKPTIYAYNSILDSFKLRNDFHGAYGFYLDIPETYRNIITYNILMWLGLSCFEYHMILKLYSELIENGKLIPGVVTCTPVLYACMHVENQEALMFGLEIIDTYLDRKDDLNHMKHNETFTYEDDDSNEISDDGDDNNDDYVDGEFKRQYLRKRRFIIDDDDDDKYYMSKNNYNKDKVLIDKHAHDDKLNTLTPLCLIPMIKLCHKAGHHARAFQFDKEFQFNYPTQYEDYKQNKFKIEDMMPREFRK